jgi:hypothetical protein
MYLLTCIVLRAACGHSYCYVCIRLWLERELSCPICATAMHAHLLRAISEEDALSDVYGVWDTTTVQYNWDGLAFPV